MKSLNEPTLVPPYETLLTLQPDRRIVCPGCGNWTDLETVELLEGQCLICHSKTLKPVSLLVMPWFKAQAQGMANLIAFVRSSKPKQPRNP